MTDKKRRKKLIIIIPIIVVILALIITLLCIIFGDPYRGIYKEVAAADREQFVEENLKKLDALEDFKTFKLTFKAKTGEGWDGGGKATEIEIKILVDGNILRAEITSKAPIKYTATVWIDNETEDTYYKVNVNGKTEEGKFAPGKEYSDEIYDAVYSIQGYGTPISGVNSIKSFLKDENAKLYSYRNKLKTVDSEIDKNKNGFKSETYFIFESNGAYRWKNVYTSYANGKVFGTICQEMKSSSEKVTIPNFD